MASSDSDEGDETLELRFATTRPGDVEQELTQQDQFNTDQVPLPATLTRESLQNTGDARRPDLDGPVRVRLSYRPAATEDFMAPLAPTLQRHLSAAAVDCSDVDWGRPDYLVLEDFGTTGLRGRTDIKDDRDFSDFWRRVGRSHKSGAKGGSWGLGKLVFPVSSRVNVVFGLTVRDDDPERTPWLMGQALLNTHRIGTVEYVPHGFFARFRDDGFPMPCSNPEIIERFKAATGVTRRDEPGFSIVVPFPRPELRPAALVPLIVEHYFFPILTGALEVDADGTLISAATIDGLLEEAKGLSPAQTAFIRELHALRAEDRPVRAAPAWVRSWEEAFPEEELERLRASYARGDLIHVRVPLSLTRKDGTEAAGDFDLVVRTAQPGAEPVALFVRNAITVPNEARHFPSRTAFGALIASEGPVSEFLRDAENPAHTSWNGNAEKLTKKWRSAAARLSRIRSALRDLNALLENAEGVSDPDALIELLNVRRAAPERKKAPNPISRPVRLQIDRSEPRYRIRARRGGFSVVAGPGLQEGHLPLRLTVRCAYAVARGNAFKRYHRADFELGGSDVVVTTTGDVMHDAKNNRIAVVARARDFSLSVDGFDPNRDVVVSVTEAPE